MDEVITAAELTAGTRIIHRHDEDGNVIDTATAVSVAMNQEDPDDPRSRPVVVTWEIGEGTDGSEARTDPGARYALTDRFLIAPTPS